MKEAYVHNIKDCPKGEDSVYLTPISKNPCDTSFTGNDSEIYDCEISWNPNKLDYEAYDGEINIINVGDGNEWIHLIFFKSTSKLHLLTIPITFNVNYE